MTQLIKKASSGIKFDKSKRYTYKNGQQRGSGVWYRDSNNNGFYDKGEQLIKPGNRIRNNDFSYLQLNSDGTITKLSDNKGNVIKGLENKISDADKYAMKHKLVYGRIASYNDKTKKWERNNNNPVQWDIDTERNKDSIDINNNQTINIPLQGGGFMRAIQQIKNGKYTETAALLPNHNKIVDFGTTDDIPEKTYEFMQKIAYPIPKTDVTYWDLNPNGGSITRGKTTLSWDKLDKSAGYTNSSLIQNYKNIWLSANPQAEAQTGIIKDAYLKQFNNDLQNWVNKYYAVNPDINKSALSSDNDYLRVHYINNKPYVELYTGFKWGQGVEKRIDANGNTIYTNPDGSYIPGIIIDNNIPYVPAESPKINAQDPNHQYKHENSLYYPSMSIKKTGGKLIRKNKSGDRIVWDNSKRYVNSKGKQFGKGVWFFDKDGDGKYTKADKLIKPGNTIYNSDKTSVQLNSNGTMTKLFNLTGIYKNSNGTYSDKAQRVIGNTKTGLSKQAYNQLIKKSGKQTADFWNTNMKQGNYYVKQNWEDLKGNKVPIIQHIDLPTNISTNLNSPFVVESTKTQKWNPAVHNHNVDSTSNKDSFWQILPNIFTYAKNYIIRRSHLATDSEQVANSKPSLKHNTEDINYTPTPINSAIKNRYIAPRFALLDTETFKPRNRGDYTLRVHSYADITATDPFIKVTGRLDPNVTYIGIDRNGHFKAGIGSDFTPGDYASRTYRNDISEFVDFTPDKQYSDRNRPTFRTTTGQTGSLNLLTTRNKQTNVYSDVSGGRVVFEPVKGKYYFVQGSIDDIRNSFNKLKKQYNVNHMQTYLLDNGSYSQGLRIKGNNLTSDILKQYDKLDTGGGNFLSENI